MWPLQRARWSVLLLAALVGCTTPPERAAPPASPAPASPAPASPAPASPTPASPAPASPAPADPGPPAQLEPPLQTGPASYSVPMRFGEDGDYPEAPAGIRVVDLDARTQVLLMRTGGAWRSHGAGAPRPVTLDLRSFPRTLDLIDRPSTMSSGSASVQLGPIPGHMPGTLDVPVHWLDSRIAALGGKLYGLAARTAKPRALTLLEIDPATRTTRAIDLPGRQPLAIYPVAGKLVLHSAQGRRTSVAVLDPVTAAITDEVDLPRPAQALARLCTGGTSVLTETDLAVTPDGRRVFIALGCNPG